MSRNMRVLVCLSLALGASACGGSDTPTLPGDDFSTLQVDASQATAYVALGATATVVNPGDPATSTAWDLAFTPEPAVQVNGGASGPGDASAYCLCANAALSLDAVEELDATAAAAAFGAVTAADIPAASAFVSDQPSQAISGWYDYDPNTHAVTPDVAVWGVRLASTSGAYAKFHVIAIPSAGQDNAGPVTIEWAVQPSATGTMGADHQLTVDLSSGGTVYVNLSDGTTSDSPTAAWDMALHGYTIALNGGASGSGDAAAVPLVPSSFYASYADITAIPVGASGIPAAAFATDAAGGAFLAAPPYRYDPTSHQVYPTYDVYLVKRGSTVYKVQVTSYYGLNGSFGQLTLRYGTLSN